ncbi:uncharacterized protein LOC103150533 isoform X1 [Poecilia formosa]|uniref:uncharacterized protein LOC103150533 isoform X1 n=1 Tax=Poecilia formosa TaxID=48698 RepID=UPI0004444405|nr:PREDICTED: uncharacterized protein LOC103150533 isoform X1 [Poecilia formosa]XP_016536283.1 PREDICTED: uncharacterized protein LOC103150533 isoform X1 [Poecilia formosa]
MTKGKTKYNSNEDMAPPQTRSLRSKKRTCPADESFQEVQVVPLQKDAEGDIKEANKTLQQTELQESAAVPNIQHEGEERSSLSKADENNSEEVDATDIANDGKEGTTVCDPSHCFELDTGCKQTNDSTNGNETGCSRSPGQPQMFVPAAEDDRKPSCAVLEKQLERFNLKRSQDTNDDKPSCGTADVKESAAGLPAKKKRRMGMCGLMEKERSHFLQAQQREGVENGAGSAGKAVCDETAEPLGSENDVSPNHLQSTPPHASADIREEREEEPQPDDHQAETEVHCSVTDMDGTGTTSNPGCSEERESEAKDGSLTDPEQNGNTEPIQLAQEGEEKHLENLQPPEVKDHAAGNATLMPEIQTKTEEDLSPREQANSLHAFTAKQQEESDADAAQPQTCGVNGTTDESKPEATDGNGGEGGASSAATQSAELNCEASLAPAAQEMSNSCDPNDDDDAAGPSVVHTERAPTRSPENSSGSGVVDYVSDSQLNTIVLIEEMKEVPDPSGHLEDATELICGLIRELSSLNRKVMVAHRELENLRRKPSRSSVR